MESQSFTYTAIPSGRYFRLLKVHPAPSDEPLQCELFSAELDNAPPYTALSYVWGDPTMSANLTCSGHACNITQSLADGLRRIRKPDQVQIAWADAICINQKDNVEKGHQVDLMGVIYDKARDVLVWLGPDPTGSSEEAFRCLRTINYKILTGTDMEQFYPKPEERPYTYLAMKPAGASEYTEMEPGIGSRSVLGLVLGERGKDCIGELFKLVWFSRVWVLQEVGLATEATAIWGDGSIAFSEIATFIRNVYFSIVLQHYLGTEISEALSGAPLYALWNVWSTYEKKNSWMHRTPALRAFAEQIAEQADLDFILVLEASRYFNATNKLDHVYAFLGHPRARIPGTDKAWIHADYTIGLKEQHHLLATSLAQDSLNFLVQVHQTEESLAPGFEHPSWVPRWNEKTPNHADAFWEAWDASLRKAEAQPFPAKVDGGKMFVSGLFIDSVDQFTRTIEHSDFEPLEEGAGQLIEPCWKLARQKPSPYPQDRIVEAFASTLSCHYKTRGNHNYGRESIVEQFSGFCMHAIPEFYKANLIPKDGLWSLNTVLKVGKMFAPAFKSHGPNRRFFNTRAAGFWGLGPAAMQPGDMCAILFGADVPFVLRPTGAANEYKVVGQCYMYSFMDGDAVLAWRKGQSSLVKEDIVLV
ncbi:heterokaryon incompatibility [Fusarium albosuccineum]|uniref:Heterokaryon incompatibility n=1 Tax=Fusarium albosuccineum TaxID=1237068 RepID=A0A8H4PLC6_9HYPO|nr:heterokaryon incompatibility [Fusarium albosuccineum]